MPTRIAAGPAAVRAELLAAGPLMAALRAPIPARAPWLTAVLNTRPPLAGRPVAVRVDRSSSGEPVAAAFLSVRRRGAGVVVTLLGQDAAPLPPGGPPARLLAADEAAAGELAAGVLRLLDGLRGPWTLRLAGLPLGDPTLGALAARMPTAELGNVRSGRLIDPWAGDHPGSRAVRTRNPWTLERWLPALLARVPDRRTARFLRAAARLHAAIDQVELVLLADGDRLRGALLTLVDGGGRWPWWGFSEADDLAGAMGSPLVTLTARGGLRAPQLFVDPGLVTRRVRRR